jgi:hypothetical protein
VTYSFIVVGNGHVRAASIVSVSISLVRFTARQKEGQTDNEDNTRFSTSNNKPRAKSISLTIIEILQSVQRFISLDSCRSTTSCLSVVTLGKLAVIILNWLFLGEMLSP